MKKTILTAVSFVAVLSLSACKKIQAGGNHGSLKLEEGVTRYSDDEQSNKDVSEAQAAPAKDSAKVATEAATTADHAKEVKAEDSASAKTTTAPAKK